MEIQYETYSKEMNIEARTMIDIANRDIIPAMVHATKDLAESVSMIKDIPDCDCSVQTNLLRELCELLKDTKEALNRREVAASHGADMTPGRDQAVFYRDVVKKAMYGRRLPVDQAELMIDKNTWPMPTYGDLIFEV